MSLMELGHIWRGGGWAKVGLGGPRWACHTICNSCLVWQVATGNLFFISTSFCQINTWTNWIWSPLIVFLALLSLCSHQMLFLKLTLLHSSAANRSLQWIVRPGSLFVPTKRVRAAKIMRSLCERWSALMSLIDHCCVPPSPNCKRNNNCVSSDFVQAEITTWI